MSRARGKKRGLTYKPLAAKRVPGEGLDLREKVVFINRVSKVVQGGRRFSFSALVVVGDGRGKVGFATGKAREVAEAVRKGVERAGRSLVVIPRDGGTLPHVIVGRSGAGEVLLRPAAPGTGLIAQSSVRAVLELAGYTDALTKCLRSNNPGNVVLAVMDGLARLQTRPEVESQRGVKLRRGRASARDSG